MERGNTFYKRSRSSSSSSMETDADSDWMPYYHKKRRIREEAYGRSVDASLNEALKEQLTCSICWDYMTSPIFQCLNGHTLCKRCNSAVKKCPTCRETLVGSRNRALETIAESLGLPCIYACNGCNENVPHFFLSEHESGCKFRPYKCIHEECAFVGNAGSLLEHLSKYHGELVVNNHIDVICNRPFWMTYPLDRLEENVVPMVKTLGNYFFIHVEKFYKEDEPKPCLRIYLDILGEEDEAKNFTYEIKFGSKKEQFLVFGSSPQSVRQKRDFTNQINAFEISLEKGLRYSKPNHWDDDTELTFSCRVYENI